MIESGLRSLETISAGSLERPCYKLMRKELRMRSLVLLNLINRLFLVMSLGRLPSESFRICLFEETESY